MFEVIVQPTGDRAEAETPEAALTAAIQLCEDARQHGAGKPTASFYRDGRLVRHEVAEGSLSV